VQFAYRGALSEPALKAHALLEGCKIFVSGRSAANQQRLVVALSRHLQVPARVMRNSPE
jgi:hypothetical protein